VKIELRLAMAGPFGLRVKGTARARIIPLASALKKRGIEAKVLIPPWDSPKDSGRTEVIGGVEVHNLRLPGSIPLIRHLLISLSLARSCLAFRPDIIWLFKPVGYTGLAAALLRPFKVPVIVDADDWEGKGGWAERNPYPLLWRAIMPVQERWTLTHADAVTAASRTLQSIIWSMGFPEAKVLYLPNGVEPLPSLGPGQRKAVALYTRFVEFAPDDLLKIWAKILEKEPEAELIIVGKGFKGEEEEFLTKATQAGIGGKVRVMGWMERDEALALLAEARVAIWPCRDNLINRAKCPAKLAELVGIGLPVVAEAVGEASSYVLPELLVESGNYEELAEKVVMLLRDEAKARELGAKGRERLLSSFLWDNLADKFLRFLEEIGLG
jgi:glycosyltransferase involved in cell wall biosynthesis